MLNAINTITGRVSGPQAAAPPISHQTNTTPPTSQIPHSRSQVWWSVVVNSIQLFCLFAQMSCNHDTACLPAACLFACLFVGPAVQVPHFHSSPILPHPNHPIPLQNLNSPQLLPVRVPVTHPHCDFLATAK